MFSKSRWLLALAISIALSSLAQADETRLTPPSAALCHSKMDLEVREPHLDPWIRDLMVGYNQKSDQTLPPSFKPLSFWTKIKNEVFLRAFRINLLFYGRGPAVKEINEIKDPTSEMRNVLSQMDKSIFGWALKGSLFNSMMSLTQSEGENYSSLAKTLHRMREYHTDFKNDMDRYRSIYGETYFTPEVIARGTINSQTMKLFAMVYNDKSIPSRDAANAIALLHPITDEALDKGSVSKTTFVKLSRFLESPDTSLQIETPYEQVMFGLLGYIYRDFPPANHPWLYSMLKQLHEAQLRSLTQKGNISHDDLLYLTFEKGGLSTAIAGYLALGGLTPMQYEFFFKAGAIFQIMDDLLDITIDLEEKGRTVWTAPIADRQSLLPALDRFLAVEKHFETELPTLMKGFPPHSSFANIYTFAFKLTLMRALSRNVNHFAKPELAWILRHFPISLNTLQQFFAFTTQTNDLVPGDIAEIIRASEAY